MSANNSQLSMTTDYASSLGSPLPALERIAQAGFTHIHWCHQWNTDFVYTEPEIEQIKRWMKELNLLMCDLHASAGREKCWYSSEEYERQAGVLLVENRLRMTAELGGDVIIMHAPAAPLDEETAQIYWDALWRSIDALALCSQETGVRIAVENGSPDQWDTIRRVLERYPADYIGLCYDCGHGNLSEEGLTLAEKYASRLISVHLHDNDGAGDQHNLIYSGTINWDRLAKMIAGSTYVKPLSFELSIKNTGYTNEEALLAEAMRRGLDLDKKVASYRA